MTLSLLECANNVKWRGRSYDRKEIIDKGNAMFPEKENNEYYLLWQDLFLAAVWCLYGVSKSQ